MSTPSPRHIGIVLAGGRGSRYDPTGTHNKLLARVTQHGMSKPCVQWSLESMGAHCEKLFLAIPSFTSANALGNPKGFAAQHLADLQRIAEALKVDVVTVPFAHRGMGETLALACAYATHSAPPQARSITVHLADMPWVSTSTIGELLTKHAALEDSDNCITVPRHQGNRGNPVIFGKALWPELQGCHGDQGARELIKRCQQAGRVNPVDMPEIHTLRDLDYQE